MQTLSTLMSRHRFSARHPVFKFGVAGIALSAVIFIVGFSAPAWIEGIGLWKACGETHVAASARCYRYSYYYSLDWLEAVQVIESIALIAVLLSMAVELYQDFYKFPPPMDNKVVETLAIFAGVLGIIGVSIFASKAQDIFVFSQQFENSTFRSRPSYSLNWGFALTAGASGLIIFCALLILCSRVQHAAVTNAAMTAPGYAISHHPGMEIVEPLIPLSIMTPRNAAYVQNSSAVPFVPAANPPQHSNPHIAMTSLAPPPYTDVQTQVRFTPLAPAGYFFDQGRYVPVFSDAFGIVTASMTSSVVPNTLYLPDSNSSSVEHQITVGTRVTDNERSTVL